MKLTTRQAAVLHTGLAVVDAFTAAILLALGTSFAWLIPAGVTIVAVCLATLYWMLDATAVAEASGADRAALADLYND